MQFRKPIFLNFLVSDAFLNKWKVEEKKLQIGTEIYEGT